ncbi:MAG: DUF3849 domain-containing protein [Oscillospiraceae bacterium]|jgi:hypothetical protein|nr:DUF3849 domain-containing protein [Oscillospiraceae bacterium]
MSNNTSASGYDTGADFWRDTAANHGLDEAAIICGNYLATQLLLEQPRDEHRFCRELFTAMYEAAANKTDPTKIVYPYPVKAANERLEASYYHDSRKRNNECAHAIDAAVHDSCYETNYYNLDLAAMKVISEYGFERVNMVLAHYIHTHEYDGRYSTANKEWAAGFEFPGITFDSAYMDAHPILIEDFANYARELYAETGAERFALPGHEGSGDDVHGYAITRSIAFDDQRGFALGHDPDAVEPYVCWQFTTENGKRDFYWGTYCDTDSAAADNYRARVIAHMHGGAREVQPTLAAAKARAEPDASASKPSVLKQLREARNAPKTPRKAKTDKHKGDEER